jgi:hypothetical protein
MEWFLFCSFYFPIKDYFLKIFPLFLVNSHFKFLILFWYKFLILKLIPNVFCIEFMD